MTPATSHSPWEFALEELENSQWNSTSSHPGQSFEAVGAFSILLKDTSVLNMQQSGIHSATFCTTS